MYRCNDCGAEFEMPVDAVDDYGDYYNSCPVCGSDDILCDVGDVDELEDDE